MTRLQFTAFCALFFLALATFFAFEWQVCAAREQIELDRSPARDTGAVFGVRADDPNEATK